MLRRVLLVLGLLALVLAAVSPALADKPQEQQNQGDNAPATLMGKAFQGTVKTIAVSNDAGTIGVETKYGDKTVQIDEDTTLKVPSGLAKRVAGEELDWADLAVGDRIVVKLVNRPAEGDLVARSVHLIPGQTFIHYTGTISAASASAISVKRGSAEAKQFTLVANTTKVWLGKEEGEFADLDVGQKVTVVARANAATALTIYVHGGKGQGDLHKADQAKDKGVNDGDDEEEEEVEAQATGTPGPRGKGNGVDKPKPNRP